MSSEEWTFVAKSNRRNNRGRNKVFGHPGLYQRSSKFDDTCTDGRRNTPNQPSSVEPEDKEEIQRAILQCIESLERQYQSRNGFAFRLYEALAEAARAPTSDHGNELKSSINLSEIVVYGIGNFSCGLYSAPMIQLAGALLLRRLAAAKISEGDTGLDGSRYNFLLNQQQTPIFYYEPCILPVEKEMLEKAFHVHVLESNEMGKLNVSNIRRQLDQSTLQSEHMTNENNSGYTLFYMPHCPMRLYCNVIWANWEGIIARQEKSDNISRILIFGNSFHAYDERIIASEQRMDPTNGVLRLVQVAHEKSIYNDAENKRLDDSLQMIERAFNDCTIISFELGNKLIERPYEYFPSEDPHENGELL